MTIILVNLQATVNTERAALEVPEPVPCILVVGQLDKINETFLVVEKKVICKAKAIILCPLLLLAAYYSYNMSYPAGLKTLYMFLEYVILDVKPKKCQVRLHSLQHTCVPLKCHEASS